MAYTKYSLTPADNNAAPPNGAPEGMLPSAVNDTMRDMMAQIRDVGDGIRGGTYTMTAPVITGGSINGTTVGASTASTGRFSTLEATGVSTFSAGTVSAPAITTTGDTNTGIFFPAADTIAFTEGGVESMRIDSSGNVGIGTSSPDTKLVLKGNHVAGAGLLSLVANSGQRYASLSFYNNTTARAFIFHDNTDALLDIYGTAGQGLRFTTNDNERMRIDSAGNVGIGTSSPSSRLTVSGSAATLGQFISSGSAAYIEMDNSGGGGYVGTTGNSLVFLTSVAGTERMRITSGGKLCVNNTTSSGGQVLFVKASPNDGAVGIQVQANGSGAIDWYNGSGGYVASVTVNASSVAYNTTSDYRLKDNIKPMTDALSKVQALKPVTYKWKVDGSDGQGFIAHELQAVVPDCVTGEKDAVDADGKPQYQGIDTSFLVATLTAAIQEQQALIQNLTTRLNALEGN